MLKFARHHEYTLIVDVANKHLKSIHCHHGGMKIPFSLFAPSGVFLSGFFGVFIFFDQFQLDDDDGDEAAAIHLNKQVEIANEELSECKEEETHTHNRHTTGIGD